MRRLAFAVLLVQLAIGGVFVALAVTGSLPFGDGSGDEPGEDGGPCPGGRAPRPSADRVDGRRAFDLLERQVALGPRPAGSPASRRLAEELRQALPGGRFQPVPGGLRNVLGTVRGSDPSRTVVVGAHYDTKDLPGFVGANDGAGGTAAVVELARSIRPGMVRPTVVFALFDGEESPAGSPEDRFVEEGLRGSKVAAASLEGAEAMILLDFVSDRDLSIPREANSDPRLWAGLRAAATRVGVGCVFPDDTRGAIADDHLPFLARGVPAIDVIDFDFRCFHRRCDDLSAVSERSLDAVTEATLELLASL